MQQRKSGYYYSQKHKRKKFNSTICGLTGVPVTKEPVERYGFVALLELVDGTSEANLEIFCS